MKVITNALKLKLYIFAISLIIANMCFSQEIISVTNIEGKAFIVGDVSENQARQRAINEAKVEALKKAGIAEHLQSYQVLFSSQVNNDFSQFFNSDIQSEMQGAVKNYQIIDEKKQIHLNTEQIEYVVVINADVVKYKTKSDITFDAVVEGIKPVYNNHDNLVFSLKTTKDCYLNIFNVTDSDVSLMYPNVIEKRQLFETGKLYTFPMASDQLDYELEIVNGKERETNRLIFVFTKEPILFIDMNEDQVTETEKVFTWIYSIMPDKRRIEYVDFTIVK